MVLSLSIHQTAMFEASQEVSYVEVSKFSHSSNQALWLLSSKQNGASWKLHVGICVFYFSMPLCKTEAVVTSCETENIVLYIIEFVLTYVYK